MREGEEEEKYSPLRAKGRANSRCARVSRPRDDTELRRKTYRKTHQNLTGEIAENLAKIRVVPEV